MPAFFSFTSSIVAKSRFFPVKYTARLSPNGKKLAYSGKGTSPSPLVRLSTPLSCLQPTAPCLPLAKAPSIVLKKNNRYPLFLSRSIPPLPHRKTPRLAPRAPPRAPCPSSPAAPFFCIDSGIVTSASTTTPEDNVFVICAAVFVFSGNETSLAALFPPLAVLSTEEAAALSAVGAFPTSAFVHADNAMQSTKVTKISFFHFHTLLWRPHRPFLPQLYQTHPALSRFFANLLQ